MAESQVARNSDALKEKTVAKCWPLLTGESRNSIQIPISFASSVALGIKPRFNLNGIEEEVLRRTLYDSDLYLRFRRSIAATIVCRKPP
jgi:hypothetical protein